MSAIVVDGVSKQFRLYQQRNQSLKSAVMRGGRAVYEDFWALDDVSFDVPEGGTFGLIGHNGSGKSTLLKCMARILVPEKGSITSKGRMSALLELGTGFHPELTARENIFLNGSILGLKRAEVERKFDEIVDFWGFGEFLDNPIKNLSSGMFVRLGFAVAINVEPDILLVDEVLAVGDEAFQRRCTERFDQLRAGGRTVVVVSHSLNTVSMICDTVALLDHGKLLAVGTPKDVIGEYLGGLTVDRDGEHDVGMRWGSRDVRITHLELIDKDGESTDWVRLGDPATFRFHYEADIAVDKPLFTLAIHHIDGTLVTNPNTRELNQVPDRIEGAGHLDFLVPHMPLIPGLYDLSAGVLNAEGDHVFDRRHRVFRFHAATGATSEVSGVLSLGGRFAGTPYGDPPVAPPQPRLPRL